LQECRRDRTTGTRFLRQCFRCCRRVCRRNTSRRKPLRNPSVSQIHSEGSPDTSTILRQTKLLHCYKMPDWKAAVPRSRRQRMLPKFLCPLVRIGSRTAALSTCTAPAREELPREECGPLDALRYHPVKNQATPRISCKTLHREVDHCRSVYKRRLSLADPRPHPHIERSGIQVSEPPHSWQYMWS
jgi:hypothetical protein